VYRAIQYEGEEWNGETISVILFTILLGMLNVIGVTEYVVVVIDSSGTDEGELHNGSPSISIFRLEFNR